MVKVEEAKKWKETNVELAALGLMTCTFATSYACYRCALIS